MVILVIIVGLILMGLMAGIIAIVTGDEDPYDH